MVVVEDRCLLLGNLRGGQWETTLEQSRRVYDPEGICPTLPTKGGGWQEVKIGEDIGDAADNICIETTIRVRRLTPREYYRLMGFSDEDFDKASAVCSETQLYKQGGNSIVVNVLEGIFENLKPYFVEKT